MLTPAQQKGLEKFLERKSVIPLSTHERFIRRFDKMTYCDRASVFGECCREYYGHIDVPSPDDSYGEIGADDSASLIHVLAQRTIATSQAALDAHRPAVGVIARTCAPITKSRIPFSLDLMGSGKWLADAERLEDFEFLEDPRWRNEFGQTVFREVVGIFLHKLNAHRGPKTRNIQELLDEFQANFDLHGLGHRNAATADEELEWMSALYLSEANQKVVWFADAYQKDRWVLMRKIMRIGDGLK